MDLFVLSLVESGAMDWECMLAFVPDDRRKRVRRFIRPADALRALAGDLLIRAVLMRKCGLKNKAICFQYGAQGKPELHGADGCHFNMSHAGNWVAVAFSRLAPVGVDVERIRPVDMGLARRFFAADEYAALMACKDEEKLPLFFRYWTLKESYLKAVGSGLTKPLKTFCICLDSDAITLCEDGRQSAGHVFKAYDLDDEHKLALCASEQGLPTEPCRLAWNELEAAFDPVRDVFTDNNA